MDTYTVAYVQTGKVLAEGVGLILPLVVLVARTKKKKQNYNTVKMDELNFLNLQFHPFPQKGIQ